MKIRQERRGLNIINLYKMAKQPFDWDKFLSWLEKNSFILFQLVRLLFGIGLKKAALAVAGGKVKEFEAEQRTLNNFTHMALKFEGVEEIADSLLDLTDVANTVVAAGSDGWQLTDLAAVIPVYNRISEIVRDFPVFTSQLGNLTPAKVTEIAVAVAERLNIPNEKAESKVKEALDLLSEGYALVTMNVAYVKRLGAYVQKDKNAA